MAYILDDIYYQLTSILTALIASAINNAIQFIQVVLMPILFPYLYLVSIFIEWAVRFINTIITFINSVSSIANLFSILFEYYFYWIPSIWAAAIYAGIMTVVTVSLARVLLRVFRG